MENQLNVDEDFDIQEDDLLRELEDHNQMKMSSMMVNSQEKAYVGW